LEGMQILGLMYIGVRIWPSMYTFTNERQVSEIFGRTGAPVGSSEKVEVTFTSM
jgi:hypothetical protein